MYSGGNSGMSLTTGKHILCLNLHALGDLVISLPVINRIASAGAPASVTSLVWPASNDLAECCHGFDKVISLPRERENPPEIQKFIREISEELGHKFDIVLDFAFQPRASWIVEAAMAHTAIGFAVPKEKLCSGYTHSLPSMETELCIEKNMRILDTLEIERPQVFDFSLDISPKSKDRLETILAEAGINPDINPPVAVHPGSGVKKRSWPVERYAEVADRIAEYESCPLVLLGGKGKTYDGTDECEVVEKLSDKLRSPALNLAGMLDLPELTWLLSRCRLFLGNNSGPGHLAASVSGTPTLLVWAPRNEHLWTPIGAKVELVIPESACRFDCKQNDCDKIADCLATVSADEVFEKYQDKFAGCSATGLQTANANIGRNG